MGCVRQIWLVPVYSSRHVSLSRWAARRVENESWREEEQLCERKKGRGWDTQKVFWRQGCIADETLVPNWWYNSFWFFHLLGSGAGWLPLSSCQGLQLPPGPAASSSALLALWVSTWKWEVSARGGRCLWRPFFLRFLVLLVHLLSVRSNL